MGTTLVARQPTRGRRGDNSSTQLAARRAQAQEGKSVTRWRRTRRPSRRHAISNLRKNISMLKITAYFGNCNLVIQAVIILQFPIALLP
jgi:hypothetical protein